MEEPENAPEAGSDAMWRVLDRAAVPVARLDLDANVAAANDAFALACGRPRGELVDTPLAAFTMVEDHVILSDAMERLRAPGAEVVEVALRLIGADGKVHSLQLDLGQLSGHQPDGGPPQVLCVARDRSHERRRERSERRSRVEAANATTTDTDSGLPNRKGLGLVLASAARRADRERSPFAVLRCEIDLPTRCTVEETESLVRACVERLRQRLRAADSVTRVDTDVLVIVAEDINDEQDAAGVAYRLLSTTLEPVPCGTGSVRVEMTVGIAMGDPQTPADTLLAAAAEAAIAAGQGGFRILDLRGLDSL